MLTTCCGSSAVDLKYKLLNVSHCFFLFGGWVALFAGLETFLGWLTKALNDFMTEGHKDGPEVHLNMDTYGAETLSSYPGLDTQTHTWHTHTHTLRRGLMEAFVPRGRHRNFLLFLKDTLTWQMSHSGSEDTESLCWQVFCDNVVMFHNKAILDSASALLQDVSTCTLCL